MFNLNRAMIIGNLTRDPELRYTPNGQAVASFAVATNRVYNDKNGEQQKEVEFHDVVAWGKLAEISTQILSKGKRVYIEGRLKTRQWDAPDGSKRQKTEIITENIIALDPKLSAESFSQDFSEAPQAFPAKEESQEVEEVSFEEAPEKKEKKSKDSEDEDIPF